MLSEAPRIGLALSGGAARGMAHVGVLRALIENDISIDCIAGTSAGSIVGGAFAAGVSVDGGAGVWRVGGAVAAGLSIDAIAGFGLTMRWRDVGRVTMSRLGIQSNERLDQYMRARLPVTRFE